MKCTWISRYFQSRVSSRWGISWQAIILFSAFACIAINSVFILYQCFADKSTGAKMAASSTLFLVTVLTNFFIFVAWIAGRLVSTMRAVKRIPFDSINTYNRTISHRCNEYILQKYHSSLYMDVGPTRSPWSMKYSHGWGRKHTRNEGIHFKRAIINSEKFLEQSILKLYPESIPSCPISLYNLRTTLTIWAPDLDQSIIDKYFSELYKAKNTRKEFSEHEYKQVMKLVISILKSLGIVHLFKKQEDI